MRPHGWCRSIRPARARDACGGTTRVLRLVPCRLLPPVARVASRAAALDPTRESSLTVHADDRDVDREATTDTQSIRRAATAGRYPQAGTTAVGGAAHHGSSANRLRRDASRVIGLIVLSRGFVCSGRWRGPDVSRETRPFAIGVLVATRVSRETPVREAPRTSTPEPQGVVMNPSPIAVCEQGGALSP